MSELLYWLCVIQRCTASEPCGACAMRPTSLFTCLESVIEKRQLLNLSFLNCLFLVVVSRALKTKGNTPKYGLIFHSSFIGRAKQRNKGRISRYLANKASIASRIDCFLDTATSAFGERLKEQVEERLRFYEEGTAPRKNVEVMQVGWGRGGRYGGRIEREGKGEWRGVKGVVGEEAKACGGRGEGRGVEGFFVGGKGGQAAGCKTGTGEEMIAYGRRYWCIC